MKSSYRIVKTGPLVAGLGVVVGLLCVLALVVAGPALAAYQQVGTFGGSFGVPVPPEVFPEQDQLGGVSSMAVNVDGAGGVPPGTVYAIGNSVTDYPWRVARYSPRGVFQEAWTPYERCGPEVPPVPPDPNYPACMSREAGQKPIAVSVDQSTGDVYVYEDIAKNAGEKVVRIYSPDGSTLISQFGEQAAAGETIAASPEKIHGSVSPGGMTVDSSGDVYVFDHAGPSDNFRTRLMVFRPQTLGDYEHYVYAGESHDISPGEQYHPYPSQPVVDDHGDVYVAGGGYIEEFEPSQPSTPICRFTLADEALTAMTVGPESGEVFYYDGKNRMIHQLHSCNGEGKFVEVEGGAFSVSPQRGNIDALVFNPVLQYEPSRAAGVLYAAAPEPIPTAGGGGEPGTSALGYIFAPPAKHEPVVESESVSKVSSSSVALAAEVNPKGANARYYFQYLTAAEYEANEPGERFAGAGEAPVGGAPLGGGSVGVPVGVTVTGLSPETEYYYRVVAMSAEGTVDGNAMSFHTFPVQAMGLPDGRGYELVSPIDKHGGEVFPINPKIGSCGSACKPGRITKRFPEQSALSGDRVVYMGSPFGSEGPVETNEYLSRRTANGWQTTTLSPTKNASDVYPEFDAFDPELTRSVLHQSLFGLTQQAPAGYTDLYTQPTSDPSAFSALLVEPPPNRSAGNGSNALQVGYAGASTDLSRIFFSANDALTGETTFAPAAVDGGEAKDNLYEWSGGGLRLVNVAPGNASTTPGAVYGAVSADGSRVFWSSQAGQVFVRESGERTVEVPDHSGRFLAVAVDGSRVLLSDGRIYGQLEDESPVEEADLTGGQGGLQGIVGHSEDLSQVYFVDTSVLDETANQEGAEAKAGKDNLYYWHEGTSRYIATLFPSDNVNAEGDWVVTPSARTGEASPDGRWVAFESQARLTGYDNTGPCQPDKNGKRTVIAPCPEVFVYDSVSGGLVCASCDRSGESPLGLSSLPTILNGGRLPQPAYLNDSGRLLFDTQSSLSPQDTNHGVEDVYEYEPAGVGSCTREEIGCVSLISGGTGSTDSNFLTMDPSGKNVFFTTRDQLTGNDRDQLVDVYDAREGGGGFPAESESAPQGCRGEACQQQFSPGSSSVGEPVPGSFTFSGPGNPIEPPPPTATSKPKAKVLSRAQRRALALKACRKKPKRTSRAACERKVRKQYAVKASSRKAVNHRGGK